MELSSRFPLLFPLPLHPEGRRYSPETQGAKLFHRTRQVYHEGIGSAKTIPWSQQPGLTVVFAHSLTEASNHAMIFSTDLTVHATQ